MRHTHRESRAIRAAYNDNSLVKTGRTRMPAGELARRPSSVAAERWDAVRARARYCSACDASFSVYLPWVTHTPRRRGGVQRLEATARITKRSRAESYRKNPSLLVYHRRIVVSAAALRAHTHTHTRTRNDKIVDDSWYDGRRALFSRCSGPLFVVYFFPSGVTFARAHPCACH